MTTFKAEVYEHQKRKDGTWNVKIRVTHNRSKRYLSTPYYVTRDDVTRAFKLKNQYYIDECNKIISSYRSIVDSLGMASKDLSIDRIIDYINRKTNTEDFDLDIVEYGRNVSDQLRNEGRRGNASAYDNAINNLVKFVGREKISVHEITARFVTDWIKYLINMPAIGKHVRGERAQSLYPATLRAILNKAKAEYNDEDVGIIRIPLSPFKSVKLPRFEHSRQRAVTLFQFHKIAEYPYQRVIRNGFNRCNLAKDMYLLSFMLIGMNEVDIFNCDNCRDAKDGRITYQRTKTKNRRSDKALISIKIQQEAIDLINKYRDPDGKRVFCFYRYYADANIFSMAINKGLKTIGEAIGIDDLEFIRQDTPGLHWRQMRLELTNTPFINRSTT